jgi:hypothetical protein
MFVLLLLVGALLVLARKRPAPGPAGAGDLTSLVSRELVDQLTALEAREEELNKTVWAKEILAENCGRLVEDLWDSLNAATNKLEVLGAFPVGELVPARYQPPLQLAHGIERHQPAGPGPPWSGLQWRRFLEESQRDGWELAQVEFRHNRVDTDTAGRPRESRFYFSANLVNRLRVERAVLQGDLVVEWTPRPSADGPPAAIRRIDASGLTLTTRRGEPPFVPLLTETLTPPENSYFIDPLILHDLDGDGLSEIILAARNVAYHRRQGNRYEPEPLCRHPPGLIFTGIIADFDGDGFADFLCAKFEGLMLFHGSPRGTFEEPGRAVWEVQPHLKYAQALTCGDIDGDGDLDVFLGQYKVPYSRGQMPTPYYDANDGYPAYLLINDGHGNFSDATAAAGLEKKRRRRTYSASFVDLDNDGALDLVVVSDFAGTDLYRNDGRGHFTDMTARWLDEPHAAGMAHAVADFNGDGLPDLLVIGMHSPTVDRLAHLGLTRPGGPGADAAMRMQLMHGNRLYLGQPSGGFRQGPLGDSIARSGWSWGCSAFDFDNDGFPDVYVANGHESRQSVRDYESEFWLHDAYSATSQEDATLTAHFAAKMSRTRGRGYSYGGYEANRLYLNQGGESFLEAGYLLGVALQEDCRNVVTDDLDGDGRQDLLVTTFEVWPQSKQVLHVYRNSLAATGNWIGFRFPEQARTPSPVGAQVLVHFSDGTRVRQIVTGDSYRSQHANTVHFGLGRSERVGSAEIQWINGPKLTLPEPEINRYHEVRAPVEARRP